MLRAAVVLSDHPLTRGATNTATCVSRTCGSSITVELDRQDDTIARVGMQVHACAVGQASASLLAAHAAGRSVREVSGMTERLEDWLKGSAALPDWTGIELLEPARAHPGRHDALLLPWKAARQALCSPHDPR